MPIEKILASLQDRHEEEVEEDMDDESHLSNIDKLGIIHSHLFSSWHIQVVSSYGTLKHALRDEDNQEEMC